MASDMDSTIDALKELLDSPGAASTLESLLGSFTSQLSGSSSSDANNNDTEQSEGKDILGDVDINKIMKIAGAYKSLNKTSDPRITLLKAIRPYVRKSRSESVDTAIKLLSLLRLAPLLGDLKDVL